MYVSPTAATSLDYMQPFRANYERPAARGARGQQGRGTRVHVPIATAAIRQRCTASPLTEVGVPASAASTPTSARDVEPFHTVPVHASWMPVSAPAEMVQINRELAPTPIKLEKIVHPADFELLGICIGDKYYYDRCLPMGCSISCALFERFSTFLEYCCRKIARTNRVLHYLDDFFLLVPRQKSART